MPPIRKESIAVIGGGATGLAVALELSRAGRRVTVYEKTAEIGGLAGSFATAGDPLERYYHHLFPGHREMLEEIAAAGLAERLIFRRASMAYLHAGSLYPLNSPRDLLRFRPLRLGDRLRVGLGSAGLLWRRDWRGLDGISAADYLSRRGGRPGYEIFWEPLLRNKFGDRAGDISAVWLLDRLQSRNRRRGGLPAGSLGYLRGGFGGLFEAMRREIEARHGRVLTGVEIAAVENRGSASDPFRIAGDSHSACVVTLPLPQALAILPGLPGDYRRKLAAVDYAHSLCLVLRLSRPLTPHYWINLGDPASPFAVMVEHTNWMDPVDYGGEHLLYLSRYVNSAADPTWTAPDAWWLEEAKRFLARSFPDFPLDRLLAGRVFREPFTQPLFTTGYSGRLPGFETPAPGLFLLNTSQFYPLSRCLNTSLVTARRFVARWFNSIRKSRCRQIPPGDWQGCTSLPPDP